MISEKQIYSPAPGVSQENLQGRVASILNAKELVINIGADKGVLLGMKFAVMAQSPTSVIDPETGEVLDIIDREKVRVEAVEVRPKITICRTYRTSFVEGNPFNDFLAGYSLPFKPSREVMETLEVGKTAYLPPLPPHESYVKIKDRVVQVS